VEGDTLEIEGEAASSNGGVTGTGVTAGDSADARAGALVGYTPAVGLVTCPGASAGGGGGGG
jgi:hypothetical protein